MHPAARYFNINSGMVFHFDPALSIHPSCFAISIVTNGPSMISPVLRSVATARHDLSSDLNRRVPNFPHELIDAMMKDDAQEGRP
jgi:hypothetical protein